MNPFGNNTPNLSAGDRIKDKKSKYIYAAAKQKFQSGKRCGTKNIKYYKKGTVRSVSSYKIQQNLARGNVLCEDCDDKGMLCSTTISRKNLEKVRLDNNATSEFWGGSTLEPWLGPDIQINPEQAPGFNVIQSDISGVWDPSANDYKGNICLTPTDCSYGYINNLIKIPRNLDGSGIIIDPSNILFPVGNCGVFGYMKKVQEKIIVKVTTNMDIYLKYSGAPEQQIEISTCDNSIVDINLFKGTYVLCEGQIGLGLANVQTIFIGVITSICCVCNTPSFNIELFYLNKSYGIPQFGIPFINNTTSSKKLPPPWYEITLEFWGIRNSTTDYLSARAAISGPPNNREEIQSFKVIQGEPCSSNSLSYNNRTKQNYMYCLEDKTKKINFRKSNIYMCEKPATFRLFCLSPGDCTGGDSITDITISGSAGPRTYRVHVFDSSGVFTIQNWPYTIDTLSSFPFDVFSVGAGAGGGGGNAGGGGAGAGGDFSLALVAGSDIQSVTGNANPPWPVNVRVGVGGTGGLGNAGFSGFGKTGTATFMTSISWTWAAAGNGGAAGSPGDNGIGGGTFSGNLGGLGSTDAGGGGGGVGGSGLDAAGAIGGNGGVGITNIITGTSLEYAGGGGGGTNAVSGNQGIGGAGGGDGGSSSSSSGIIGSLPGAGGGGGGVVGGVGGGGGDGANGRLVIRYLLCT